MPEPRRATVADAAAVADVYLRSRRSDVAFAPLAHPEPEVRRWIADEVVGAGRALVLGDPAVAFAATSVDDRGCGWLDHLYVDPAHTGRGLGTVLLDAALDELPCVVLLWTFVASTGARRFYERHGFTAVLLGDGSGNEERVPDVLYELP